MQRLSSPFIQKLRAFTKLSEEDEQTLLAVAGEHTRRVAAREDVASEGSAVSAINVFLSGWGCRYRYLPDGRRQILALLLPGDMCDLSIFVLERMDHSVGALTTVHLGEISPRGFEVLTNAHLRLRQALWWEQLVANSIQREWTLSLGQRSALERLAHLFCEVFTRLEIVGHTNGNSCDFPLTQNDLGEIGGISAVHVNRTLQAMRSDRLIELEDRVLTIPDFNALADVGMFDPAYLHLDHVGQHLGANV